VIFIGTIDESGNPEYFMFLNWLLAIIIGLVFSWLAYRISITLGQVRWSMRIGFSVLIGGLLLYIYAAFGLPGINWLQDLTGIFAGSIATLAGNSLGLISAIVWKNISV
jgi:hypothetical protein